MLNSCAKVIIDSLVLFCTKQLLVEVAACRRIVRTVALVPTVPVHVSRGTQEIYVKQVSHSPESVHPNGQK